METPYVCKECGMPFKNKKHLLDHERRHSGQSPYRCCGKGFTSRAHLTRHRCSKHGETKYHVCATCGKSFALATDLKRHELRESGQLKLTCDVCGFKCDDTTNLSDHMSAKHRDMTRHKCSQCPSAFKFKSGLSRHNKAKHT